jgi:hypothetical protein
MKNLFSVNSEGAVEALPQAWLFQPFANIRAKYSESAIASVELGLVYFAADYRSNFLSVSNIQDRVLRIQKDLYAQRKLKIDEVTYEAIKFYQKEQDDVNIRLIKAVSSAVEKAIITIEVSDMDTLDDIKLLSDIAAKLPGMMQNLAELEKFVKKGTQLEEGVVGSGQKSLYEDHG